MADSQRFSGRIISGNRVTIRNHIMEDLDLHIGDKVDIVISKKQRLREGLIL